MAIWKRNLEKPTHFPVSVCPNQGQAPSQFRVVLTAGRMPPRSQRIKNILQLIYLLQFTKNGRQATARLAVVVHSAVVWVMSPTHRFYPLYYLQSLPPASYHLLPLHPPSHIVNELEYHPSALLLRTWHMYPAPRGKNRGNPFHQSILQSYISCQNFTFA